VADYVIGERGYLVEELTGRQVEIQVMGHDLDV
jgi:hypothetical protein